MLSRPEISTITSMAEGLVDTDAVWHCPYIMPGAWTPVGKTEAIDFIARHIAMDRAEGNPPFLALYPPIKIEKLELGFAPIVLWQIAVDVDFDVGVIDIIDVEKAKDTKPAGTKGKNRTLDQLAASNLPQKAETPESANDPDGVRHLTYLADDYPIFDRFDSGLSKAEPQQAPNKAFTRISRSLRSVATAENAIEAVQFALSLSRRRAGRLAVALPDNLSAIVPPGIEMPDASTIDCSPSTAYQIDKGWEVKCNVWLGSGLWQITAQVSADSIRVSSITKRSALPERATESMVGPVRLFDFVLPQKIPREPA